MASGTAYGQGVRNQPGRTGLSLLHNFQTGSGAHPHFQTGSGAHPHFQSTGTGVILSRAERQKHEVEHSRISGLEVKNEWRYNPTPPYTASWCGQE